MRHTLTKSDITEVKLSSQQHIAIGELLSGKNITETAEGLGISRQTLSSWLNHSSQFQAEMNKRRLEIIGESADYIRALIPKAIKVLEEELENGPNRALAAVTILKLLKFELPKVGPTDPEVIDLDNKDKETDKRFRSLLR
jgi:hypothetical protein